MCFRKTLVLSICCSEPRVKIGQAPRGWRTLSAAYLLRSTRQAHSVGTLDLVSIIIENNLSK